MSTDTERRERQGHDRDRHHDALGLVEDVMTRRVVSIAEAPVVRGRTVVGVVTLTDLLRKAPERATPIATTGSFHG